MRLLAMDASGQAASVCILGEEGVLCQRELNKGLTHSETLLALVDETLAAASLTPQGISLYAVTAGPGSFTGLRIGMGLAKGLCLPGGTPLVGVSTLEAHCRASGLVGSVVVALDARRGEVYWAAFDTRAGYKRLTPDAAAPATSLHETLAALPAPVYLIGDGAGICYTTFKESLPLEAPRTAPCIAYGAALAAVESYRAGQPAGAAEVRPGYLRLSQAERERAEAQARQKQKGEA